MAALAIVRRDLIRYLRNPVRTAMLFAVPLMLSGIFALVFGGGGADQISIKVLLFDEDDSLLSKLLEGAGGSSEMDQQLDFIPVGEEGYEMMERGEASALIHLPKGFSSDYLAGRPTTIEVVKNPSERFLPRVVDEGVILGAVCSVGGFPRVSQRTRDDRRIRGIGGLPSGPRGGVRERRLQPETQGRRTLPDASRGRSRDSHLDRGGGRRRRPRLQHPRLLPAGLLGDGHPLPRPIGHPRHPSRSRDRGWCATF